MAITDTTATDLIINKLTKDQYASISSPSNTQLYFVEDEHDTSNYYTKEEVLALIGDLTAQINTLKTRITALENA